MADKEFKSSIPPWRALGLAGRIAHGFIDSKLTPLVIVGALLIGAFSILKTPREEEAVIVVTMLDVFVQMAGASAEEVAQRVSVPTEKLLRDVPGVEYVYSISHPGVSMLVVRFYVGTKEENAIVQTYNKLYSNFDRIPPGGSQPIIKVRSIDDVPILALTLWGKDYDSYHLRRIAGELENSLKPLDGVSETKIIGGEPRQVRVALDTQRLTAYGLTPGAIVTQLQNTNSRGQAGSFARANREFQVEAGTFFTSLEDLNQVVVGVHAGRPVYLRDVAEKIQDGPAEPNTYVLFANARGGAEQKPGVEYPAVTITLSKRKGTNATDISGRLLDNVNALRGYVLPNDLNITVTRNYGETAKDKSDELLVHLLIATLSVTLLIGLALGWRESAAMLFSLVVAFVVLPWAASRLLTGYRGVGGHSGQQAEGWTTRLYRRVMNPLILNGCRRWMFLGGVGVLLLAAIAFVPLKWVRLKMLPFDNKSEFQVIVDMPDGTPLEQTTHVAEALGQYLGQQPEVMNYQIYAGTSGPYNFNGLVRHYFLRNQPNQADIQVNLLSRHDRRAQSHEIARRLRPELDKIATPFGARIKVAEVPPGPPVLQTLVAEVYGPDYKGQIELAAQVKKVFQQTSGVVDVDWYVEDPQTKYDMKVDLEKAALHGISPADITRTVQIGLGGATAGLLHDSHSREDIPIEVRLGRPDRSARVQLGNFKLRTPSGAVMALWE